jgi:predicted cupin superfamily sugar epimerase
VNSKDIIEALKLTAHPEGGHYRETWRDDLRPRRGTGTAIYYLLQVGERSHWHRIDAAEIWHFYAGAPLELLTYPGGGNVIRRVLGPNLEANERPLLTVAPNEWQSARTLGDWTLVGCTVSPAFEFNHLEIAPEHWSPGTET